jgi:hypothetical protein
MRSPEDFPDDIREKASQIAGAIDRCFSVYQDPQHYGEPHE